MQLLQQKPFLFCQVVLIHKFSHMVRHLNNIVCHKKVFVISDMVCTMYIRPFHYPEDHGGMRPKEFPIYVGPKSKISEKKDQS